MDDLLGGQHNIVFPVVGIPEGLEVCRPEALGHSSSVTALYDTASSRETMTATPTPPRKHRRVDDEMMQFLRVSEEASQQRHKENLVWSIGF